MALPYVTEEKARMIAERVKDSGVNLPTPSDEDIGKALVVGEDKDLEYAEVGGGGGTKLYLHTLKNIQVSPYPRDLTIISVQSESLSGDTYADKFRYITSISLHPLLFLNSANDTIYTMIVGDVNGLQGAGPIRVNMSGECIDEVKEL